MAHVAISAIGLDQPGIVAEVTGVLVEHECNIEDTSMSILRGHFAMMLVVAVPGDLAPATLEEALEPVAAQLGLVMSVRAIDDESPEPAAGAPWSLSIYGADRPGIVHRVTRLLADQGVNIVELTTRVVGEAGRPTYVMLLEITLPAAVDSAVLQADLLTVAADLGVACTLHAVEPDVL